jgi:hypothetical protein
MVRLSHARNFRRIAAAIGIVVAAFLIGLLWHVPAAHAQTEVNDTNSNVSYTGTWGYYCCNTVDYDSDQHYSNGTGASATFTFTGTDASIITETGPNFGVANILVDGSLVATVDAYSAAQQFQQTLYTASNLASGCHTVTLQVSSAKNAASSNTYQVADAFTTNGSAGCSSGGGGGGSVTEINDTDPSVVYSVGDPATGTTDWWYLSGISVDVDQDEHSSYWARSCCGGTIQGADAVVNFNGTGITWIGKKGPNYGQAAVSIDGGTPQTFDAYNSTELDQNPNVTISGLPSGSHVLQISLLGNKNSASSNTWQTVDAFEVSGTPVPLSDATVAGYNSPQLVFTGTWTIPSEPPYSYPDDDLSGGHDWSETAASTVSWTFNGSLIEVYGRPDDENGYFKVFIDGNYITTVDGHWGDVDDDSLNSYMLFADKLAPGAHTIKLVVTGTNDGNDPGQAPNNNYVQIDEFVAFP